MTSAHESSLTQGPRTQNVEETGPEALLTVRGLRKSYDRKSRRPGRDSNRPARHFAVDDVSFDVGHGEVVTLIGPSGCGKTTTLRSIAGLEVPDEGDILLAGRPLFSSAQGRNVPASKRGLGMVFQSYAIWPHLDVFDNIAMPLRATRRSRSLDRTEIAKRVEEVLAVTGLSSYIRKPATKLSGGQQQRLALARALATRPQLILLDEPLSNLDAKLRESMRLELSRLQRELGLTSIYVTHDQDEALAMSTLIVVMNEGRILQIGAPEDIYNNPASRFVAEFVGTSNIVHGTVASLDAGTARVDASFGSLYADGAGCRPGADVVVAIRPESLLMNKLRSDQATNDFPGRVITRAFLGDVSDYLVQVGGATFRTRSNASSVFEPGEDITVTFAPGGVRVLAGDGDATASPHPVEDEASINTTVTTRA